MACSRWSRQTPKRTLASLGLASLVLVVPQTVLAAANPPAAEQGPPVSTTIVMRLVDTILSDSDPPGRQYRAVVTRATSAGSVSIPVNTEARITLAQAAGTWSAQLASLSLNGQNVPVTSSSVSASTAIQQAEQRAQELGVLLGGLGKSVPAHTAANTAVAAGPRVMLSTGTTLTFTASVPQPMAHTSSAGSGAVAAPAAAGPSAVAASTTTQGNVVAPATGGGSVAMCEFTGAGKYYYSAIFDVPNDNDKAHWEIAWGYYVNKHVDPFPGNSGCTFYRTRAAAQRDLQIHKDMAGAKLIETGWVYTGPDQLPPPAPRHASTTNK